MKLGVSYRVMLLLVISMGLYYSAIFNPINLIDDSQILRTFEWDGKEGFFPFLLPGNGFYYRPILMLTFYLDYLIWGNEPSFLHLENILLHASNVVLLYFFARRLFLSKNDQDDMFPLLAALLFAVHPINTESVNWIAGRSDLLATTFLLVSLILLLSGLRNGYLSFVFAASSFFVAGVLSKEIFIFSLPLYLGLILFRGLVGIVPSSRPRTLLEITVFVWPLLVGGFLIVSWKLTNGLGGALIERIIDHYRYGFWDTIRVFLKVWGFYIKKLFFPLPLNFAIISISELYLWVGLVFFPLWIFWLCRGSLSQRCFVVSLYLIAPALIIAVLDATWTPIAERYLYFSTVFFALSIAGFVKYSRSNFFYIESLVYPLL